MGRQKRKSLADKRPIPGPDNYDIDGQFGGRRNLNRGAIIVSRKRP